MSARRRSTNCWRERADSIAAIIVEPLVQGAGGMKFHDASVLKRLRALADQYDVLLIFDEMFTGFGRTGTMFACEAAGVTPDIITLSKALTGGTLPLAATVATQKVFDAFWSDDPKKALMHGPSYMANALGCAAANASLDLFEQRAALATGRRHLVRAVARAGALPQHDGRQGRARQGRHRRGRDANASIISTPCARASWRRACSCARSATSSISRRLSPSQPKN